jgi:hypothetical protein
MVHRKQNCKKVDIEQTMDNIYMCGIHSGVEHYQQLHHLLCYIHGTSHYSLTFGLSDQGLTGYSDSDFASDKDDSRSIGGYVYYLFGSPISWRSQKQSVVATSSTEAEYIAPSHQQNAYGSLWLYG